MEQRVCTKCKVSKPVSDYYKKRRGNPEPREQCKKCVSEAKKAYRNAHKDVLANYNQEYYKQNEDRYATWRKDNKERIAAYNKEYYAAHRSEIIAQGNEYVRNRVASDLSFKLRRALRTRLGSAVRNRQKAGSAVKDLGCTMEEFRTYLEEKFEPGMSWENWSKTGWHIDHIKPLSSFDLTDPEQFKQAVHYSNLQPLWADENLRKNDAV